MKVAAYTFHGLYINLKAFNKQDNLSTATHSYQFGVSLLKTSGSWH